MLRVELVKVDVSTKKTRKIFDQVAEESPLHIFLNRTHYATIFCSPSNQKEMAVGQLLSEGIIESIDDMDEISLEQKGVCRIRLNLNVDLKKRLKAQKTYSRVILSACGSPSPYKFSTKLPKIQSKLTVKAEVILDSVHRLNSLAKVFRKTGGVHAAAIYDCHGNLKAFAEDVGRHNAVDKVIGIGALDKIDFTKCFLSLTGRLTGDIVAKAARVRLPIVASLAAAINSGLAVANEADLTIIGFARGKRMNIYNSPERILS